MGGLQVRVSSPTPISSVSQTLPTLLPQPCCHGCAGWQVSVSCPGTGRVWTTSAHVTSRHRALSGGTVYSRRDPSLLAGRIFPRITFLATDTAQEGPLPQFLRNSQPCLAKPRSLCAPETRASPKTARNGMCAHFWT